MDTTRGAQLARAWSNVGTAGLCHQSSCRLLVPERIALGACRKHHPLWRRVCALLMLRLVQLCLQVANSSRLRLQVQAMAILSEGVVDASCASHFGKYGVWRCYLGQYAAPFIKVTSLFLQNQVSASISTIVTSEGTKVKGLSLRVLSYAPSMPYHKSFHTAASGGCV